MFDALNACTKIIWSTDAAAMIEEICTDMKYIFQNNGASKVIADGGTYNGTRLKHD